MFVRGKEEKGILGTKTAKNLCLFWLLEEDGTVEYEARRGICKETISDGHQASRSLYKFSNSQVWYVEYTAWGSLKKDGRVYKNVHQTLDCRTNTLMKRRSCITT